MKPILQIVFPEGNDWFYPLSLIWFMAIAVFLISLPVLLVSTGYWYEHETGTAVDMDSELANLSAVFLVVSCAFDMYSFYLAKRKERDEWL